MHPGESGSSQPEALARVTVDDGESVYLPVIRAVAVVENVPATELPPLAESIEPEALDDLVSAQAFAGTVTFEYDDYVVSVENGDTVAIYADDPRPQTT